MENKEKEPKSDIGYSEKKLDISMDKTKNQNTTRGGNIFDPGNPRSQKASQGQGKKKEKVILDSQSQ